MKQTKTFIYYEENGEYFQKNIILKRKEVKTENIYFNLTDSNFVDRFVKESKIKKEMKKLVKNNDVIICTSDFTYMESVIITTGGVIIGDAHSLDERITSRACTKREIRKARINKNFKDYAYNDSKYKCYTENFEIMKNLINILSKLLYTNCNGKNDVYEDLLDCLIETTEPIKSSDYEEKLKRLLKEYPNN